jgi:hypothetical protein
LKSVGLLKTFDSGFAGLIDVAVAIVRFRRRHRVRIIRGRVEQLCHICSVTCPAIHSATNSSLLLSAQVSDEMNDRNCDQGLQSSMFLEPLCREERPRLAEAVPSKGHSPLTRTLVVGHQIV